MIIRNVELEIVCGITSRIPENELPEIAFAGKSNVGKSSLINTMMNRKALARTSAQPGKTQTINFYNINNAMYLVDLPGYGFAKAPEAERVKWGRMIENYLHCSKQLKAVFLLVDIRHEPSENDKMMYHWIVSQGYRPIIIATKLDKLKRSQIEENILKVKKGLELNENDLLIPFSSVSGQGREEVWQLMDDLIGWKEPEKPSEKKQSEKKPLDESIPSANPQKKARWKKEKKKEKKKVKKQPENKKKKKKHKKHAENWSEGNQDNHSENPYGKQKEPRSHIEKSQKNQTERSEDFSKRKQTGWSVEQSRRKQTGHSVEQSGRKQTGWSVEQSGRKQTGRSVEQSGRKQTRWSRQQSERKQTGRSVEQSGRKQGSRIFEKNGHGKKPMGRRRMH